jgi:hypothetical protein
LFGAARNAASAARRARRAADGAAADPIGAAERAQDALGRATEALGVVVREKKVGLTVLARLEAARAAAAAPVEASKPVREDDRQARLREALDRKRAAASAAPPPRPTGAPVRYPTPTVGDTPSTGRWGAVSRTRRGDPEPEE